MKTRKCRECVERFVVSKEWQVFCSTTCRRRWNKRFNEHCFYCGRPGTGRDHIHPVVARSLRGYENQEHVRACFECNSTLNSNDFSEIRDRIQFLIDAYTKKYKLKQAVVEWSDTELEELEYPLRSRIRKILAMRHEAEEKVIYLNRLKRTL